MVTNRKITLGQPLENRKTKCLMYVYLNINVFFVLNKNIRNRENQTQNLKN